LILLNVAAIILIRVHSSEFAVQEISLKSRRCGPRRPTVPVRSPRQIDFVLFRAFRGYFFGIRAESGPHFSAELETWKKQQDRGIFGP
jgi:hypothetical protein